MSDVFISYSRDDSDFVRRLHAALEAQEREAWVDWEGIPPTAEWMDEIHRAIETAQAVIFIVSPSSVESQVCRAELDYAVELGKRLVPIVSRETEAATLPEILAKLNWIFFTNGNGFEASFAKLLQALDTDLEHVRAHTRVLVRAQLWSREDEDNSYLLRGRDLEEAEQWLQLARSKEPPPTQLQTRYILEGERWQRRQQRRVLIGISVAFAVAIALAVVALYQRNEADQQRRLAVARALATQSELALGDTGEELVASTLLAVESLRSAQTTEGMDAWRRTMKLLPKPPIIVGPTLLDTTSGEFSSNQKLWTAGMANGSLAVGTTSDPEIHSSWQALGTPIHSLTFGSNNAVLVVGGEGELAVWEYPSGSQIGAFHSGQSRLDTFGRVWDIVFSSDGTELFAAAEGYGVEVIATDNWRALPPLAIEESRSFSLALHPSGTLLAVGGFGWTAFDLRRLQVTNITDFRREEIDTLRFSRAGHELATADLAVRVWDLEVGDDGSLATQPADRLVTSDQRVHDVAFSASGRYLAVAREDGTVKVLEAKTGAEVQRLSEPGPAWRAAFTADDRRIMTISDRYRMRDVLSKEETYRLYLDVELKHAFFIGDGKWLAVTSEDGLLRLVEPQELVEKPPLELGMGITAVLSGDGQWLAAAGSSAVIIVDTRALEPLTHRKLDERSGFVALQFDARSEILAAVTPEVTAVFDIKTRAWRDLIVAGPSTRWRPHFTEDGHWLVLDGSGVVRLFQTQNDWHGTPEFRGSYRALSPDQSMICTSTPVKRGVRPPMLWIWSIASGGKLAWGPESRHRTYPGASEPENKGGDATLVAVCDDWPASLAADGQSTEQYSRQSDRWQIETDRDSVRLIARQSPDMIREACARLHRNLTYEEWCQYMPGEDYRASCDGLSLSTVDSAVDCAD